MTSANGEVPRLQVHVDGVTASGIHLVNLVFTLLSGGLYYFWGKARSLAYAMGQIEFEGDRFVFLATGRELFRGWCKAASFFSVFVCVQFLISLNDASSWQLWSTVFFYVVAVLLAPLATVGILRFRLHRTAWRGVHFSFRGNVKAYAKVFLPHALLTIVSLGFYYPIFAARTQAYLMNHTYFGDEPFHYDGTGRELLRDCAASLFKSVFTLGFQWTWFHARKKNYDWAHTSFRGLRFESKLTGRGLTWLWSTNLVLFFSTLGFALPWLQLRSMAYVFSRLDIIGSVDWASIGGSGADAGAEGEQLGELLGSSLFDA